jgi:hypothetical protein
MASRALAEAFCLAAAANIVNEEIRRTGSSFRLTADRTQFEEALAHALLILDEALETPTDPPGAADPLAIPPLASVLRILGTGFRPGEALKGLLDRVCFRISVTSGWRMELPPEACMRLHECTTQAGDDGEVVDQIIEFLWEQLQPEGNRMPRRLPDGSAISQQSNVGEDPPAAPSVVSQKDRYL